MYKERKGVAQRIESCGIPNVTGANTELLMSTMVHNPKKCFRDLNHIARMLGCLLKIKVGDLDLSPFQVVRFMKKKLCKMFG